MTHDINQLTFGSMDLKCQFCYTLHFKPEITTYYHSFVNVRIQFKTNKQRRLISCWSDRASVSIACTVCRI